MHLEYVVLGPPITNQAATTKAIANLNAWKGKVKAEVQSIWGTTPTLKGRLKAIIINFHTGEKPPLDVDNMSKPILDVMQQVVYENDRQITQAELTHVRIDAPMSIAGASKILVDAVQKGQQFVYVRIEDAVDPFPLPK